jgi:hypothetical protein
LEQEMAENLVALLVELTVADLEPQSAVTMVDAKAELLVYEKVA